MKKTELPAVLEPYANRYRVALISTQGRFVDYVKRFVASVIKEDAIVVTLLDDDKVGREMAKSTNAINVGVNKDTVHWLQNAGGVNQMIADYYYSFIGRLKLNLAPLLLALFSAQILPP